MDKNRRKTGKPRGGRRSTSFKKGQPSANPKGRPKKDFDLVTRCRELTPAIIEHYGKLGARARSGPEVQAGRVVIEYAYDKPRQRTEVTGAGGGPIRMASSVEDLTTEEARKELDALLAEATTTGAAVQAPAGGRLDDDADDLDDDGPPG